MNNLKAAQAAYAEANNALTAMHAELRALTVSKTKTVEGVKAAYVRFDAVRAAFDAAKDALDAAELSA